MDEANRKAKTQMDAYSACLFLPDYLMEEAYSDSGALNAEAMEEF